MPGNTSTRKCASVAAQPCSDQCLKTVAQTRIRPRTLTEIRLSPCLRRPIVCPASPLLPDLLFIFALRSLLGVSAMIKVVSAYRWIFSLVVSWPFGYDQVSICLFWVDRFVALSRAYDYDSLVSLLLRLGLVLARWPAWNPPR